MASSLFQGQNQTSQINPQVISQAKSMMKNMNQMKGIMSMLSGKGMNPEQGATAIATATAIGDIVSLPISALVRLNCDCDTANLTIVIGGQAVTAQNLAVVVEKI